MFIFPGVSTFDHFTVVLVISDPPWRGHSSSIKIPDSFYVKEGLMETNLQIWRSHMHGNSPSPSLFASPCLASVTFITLLLVLGDRRFIDGRWVSVINWQPFKGKSRRDL